jgi:uncharacterized protein (DUF427 family)
VPRATLNGITLAGSDDTVIVEGNHYFPPGSVNMDLFRESGTTTHYPWKGDASYLSVEADGDLVEDAAWYYPEPMRAAENIRDHVAFYGNKVEVGG